MTPETPPAPVLLGLGANLGDPAAQLAAALARLRGEVRIDAVSRLFRTEPVGFRDQPDFVNLVCAGATQLEPAALLARLHAVEAELGRLRSFRNAPRVIDIDLLAYGDVVVDSPALTLPHPGIAARAFVLAPLCDVAPGWRHPVLGRTAQELLSSLGVSQRVEPVGMLPFERNE